MNETWRAVDEALAGWVLGVDDALEAALQASASAGLPAINVSPLQGKFLSLLATSVGARRVLEIGTLGGYSTIWLARAIGPEGRLTTLELDPHHAEVARSNLDSAGVGDRVDVVVGVAAESLHALDGERFDLTFIDADKASTPLYFDWAVTHTRPGGLVVVDNVVRQGAVIDADTDDPNIRGMREFLQTAGRDARVSMSVLQTVGVKGYDGFALAVVG